jgi:hypothetical protein
MAVVSFSPLQTGFEQEQEFEILLRALSLLYPLINIGNRFTSAVRTKWPQRYSAGNRQLPGQ